jgi:hypothetical protein
MPAQSRPFGPARGSPPPWAVLTVKCCVIGILAMPLAVPLLLAATVVFGPQGEPVRRVAFFASFGVWAGLFATAQYLTTVFPPVQRQR